MKEERKAALRGVAGCTTTALLFIVVDLAAIAAGVWLVLAIMGMVK